MDFVYVVYYQITINYQYVKIDGNRSRLLLIS